MKRTLLLALCLSFGISSVAAKSHAKKDLKNYKEFFQLAKSGDVDSQTLLGEMYLKGSGGVKVDTDKAFYWLAKASNSNDAQAQYLLGYMYENGIKVAVNISRAVTLYKKAAKRGDILAQYSLAMIYKEGKGEVEKDAYRYRKWLASVEDSKKLLAYQARK